jgi:hypothetical protein
MERGTKGFGSLKSPKGEERHVKALRNCIVKQVWKVACISRFIACQVGGPCEGFLPCSNTFILYFLFSYISPE